MESIPDRSLLDAAYAAAVFRFTRERPRAFTFGAIGERPTADLADFPGPWGVLTAFNPHSITISAEKNAERTRELKVRLERAHLAHEPSVSTDTSGKHREDGFAIFGIDRERLLALAREFGQRAEVFADGPNVGLLYTETERWVVLPARAV